ncbi:hypothetical protein [Bradyrhizobium sp. STM 3557]
MRDAARNRSFASHCSSSAASVMVELCHKTVIDGRHAGV